MYNEKNRENGRERGKDEFFSKHDVMFQLFLRKFSEEHVRGDVERDNLNLILRVDNE